MDSGASHGRGAAVTKAHGWQDHGEHTLRDPRDGFQHVVRLFTKGGCKVLVSHEDHSGKPRWHLSISREDRYPGWDEIKDARYALLPVGLTFAMLLPPLNEYVNVHRNCFHLHEIDPELP